VPQRPAPEARRRTTPNHTQQQQMFQRRPVPDIRRTKRNRRQQGRPTAQRRPARQSTLRDPTTAPYHRAGIIVNTIKQNAGTEERGQRRKVPPPEELAVCPP
jgi:cell envelope opacity-associated protein A